MNAAVKLTSFAALLGVLGIAGAAAGGAIDPSAPGSGTPGGGHAESPGEPAPAHGEPEGGHGGSSSATAVRGLAVAQDELRLVISPADRVPAKAGTLKFRIVDDSGAVIRDFDVAHEKRMHLIVVRRDLTGFQHLHPTQDADGSWTAPLTLREPGSYRVFADFTRAGEAVTLGSDLELAGQVEPRPLPASQDLADAGGGLAVARTGATAATAGRPVTLGFSAARGGAPVRLQPYLGAGGHLVALREGDLAFLHVHPTDDPAAWAAGRAAFETQFPTPGRYRLFLQVRTGGEIRTAAFTQEVK